MKICVEVHSTIDDFEDAKKPWRSYVINYGDQEDRRVFGEQCKNALEGGQVVVTYQKERK